MLDETVLKDRIIASTLKLAAGRPWREITLAEIAEDAKTNLVELRREFPSKGAILAAFMRKVDDAVLARCAKPSQDPARDRLFEVVMCRFEVLEPYKAGLRSIAAARPMDLELMKKAFASQAWMLHAAGITTDGPLGPVRVAGLGTLYASVLDTWLGDDDPGLARTMAALDRRLKRGEQAMSTLDGLCSRVSRLANCLRPGRACDTAKAAPGEQSSGERTAEPDPPMGYGRA